MADLVDRVEVPGQVLAAVEIPEDDRAFRCHEGVAHGVVGAPQLHIGRVRRIADVERIVEKHAGHVARAQLLADARQPVASGGLHIRRIEPACRPFPFGEPAVADDVLVEARRLLDRVRGKGVVDAAGPGCSGSSNGLILRRLAPNGRPPPGE
ncbi:MAG: hypothetical protein WKF78_11440 [Candidatus Limnocylindrales bacterium]